MKEVIKAFVLGFITLVGCSCSVEEYNEPTTHNVAHYEGQDVPQKIIDVIPSMKGEYLGHDLQTHTTKDEVKIEESIIKVNTSVFSQTFFIEDYVMEGKVNCYIRIFLYDGSVLTLYLAWLPETPENRNMMFVKLNEEYISILTKVEYGNRT